MLKKVILLLPESRVQAMALSDFNGAPGIVSREKFRHFLNKKATPPPFPCDLGSLRRENSGGLRLERKDGVSFGLSQVSFRARM